MVKKKIISEPDPVMAMAQEYIEIEKIIRRSHGGPMVDPYAPLAKKSQDKEILARLEEIERDIIERARRKGII